jgi:hypothetical protein
MNVQCFPIDSITSINPDDYPKFTATRENLTCTFVQPIEFEGENGSDRWFDVNVKRIPDPDISTYSESIHTDKKKVVEQPTLHFVKTEDTVELFVKHTVSYPKVRAEWTPRWIKSYSGGTITQKKRMRLMKKVDVKDDKEDLKNWVKKELGKYGCKVTNYKSMKVSEFMTIGIFSDVKTPHFEHYTAVEVDATQLKDECD